MKYSLKDTYLRTLHIITTGSKFIIFLYFRLLDLELKTWIFKRKMEWHLRIYQIWMPNDGREVALAQFRKPLYAAADCKSLYCNK